MALVWQSHNLLIEVATPYQMIVTVRRQLARSESINRMFSEVWHRRTALKQWKDRGVVAGMVRQASKLGWKWLAPFEIHPKHGRALSLVCPMQGWFKHQVCESLRQTMLASTPKRKDMAGIMMVLNMDILWHYSEVAN